MKLWHLTSLVFANLLAFGAISLWLGGDAINGYAIDGTYVLSNQIGDTPVSKGVYTYSLWHARLTILSFLALCAVHLIKRWGGPARV